MSVAPYPEYRSSPLTPTGVAPKHWLDGAVKRGFRITLGKMVVASNENDDRTTQPYLRSANVQDGWLALDDVKEMYFSPTEAASLSLLEGDLVICEGGDVGRCALLRENLEGYGFQNSINRARGIGDNCTAYLAYWLSHLKNNGFIDVLCNKSTIAHYTAEKLANTPMLMPPPGEQSAIAAFLDQETGKIDALVAEQERLIALLKEKRQAVISQAVTKGLNPNAPMKDSGIEWLGQVPAHWKICQLKRTFRSVDYGISDALALEGSIIVLRMNNIQNGAVSLEDVKYTENVDQNLILEPGDLLYNRTNSLDLIGKVGVYEEKSENLVSFASYLVRFRLREGLPKYFAFLLNTNNLLGLVRSSAYVAIGQCNLNPTKYGEIVVAVPPPDEQAYITHFLNAQVKAIDTLITEATQAITLLRERRAALISAAVTGKIDVRSLAPTKQEAA